MSMTIQGPDQMHGPMLGPMPVLMPGPLPGSMPGPIAGPMPEPIAGLMQDPMPRTFHIRVPMSPLSLISFPYRRMQMPYAKPAIIRVAKLEDKESDFITALHFALIMAQSKNGKNHLKFCSYPCTPGDLNKFCMITPRPKSCPFKIAAMISQRYRIAPTCVRTLSTKKRPG